jgi:hypothetical protein
LNIGVMQRRSGLSFALKPPKGSWIFSQLGRKKLQRDEPMKRRVLSVINHTHTAAAGLLDDAVMRNALGSLAHLQLARAYVIAGNGAKGKNLLPGFPFALERC